MWGGRLRKEGCATERGRAIKGEISELVLGRDGSHIGREERGGIIAWGRFTWGEAYEPGLEFR